MPRKSRSKVQIKPEIGARKAAQTRRSWLIYGGGALLAIALLTFLIIRQLPESVPGEQEFADQGFGERVHIADATVPHPAYNSNPPTSGYHAKNETAPWGIRTETIADEISLHNLEHGGVAFHYRQDLDADSLKKLQDLVAELQRKNSCVLMLPRPADKINAPVVGAAWHFLLEQQTLDVEALRAFFRAHVGRGPEQQCSQWKD
jgi:hypothetical protein